MEITYESKMMLIPVEDVGRDVDSLSRSIDQLGVPLLETFRNGIMCLRILGMLEL
jgi:hypothetical protein